MRPPSTVHIELDAMFQSLPVAFAVPVLALREGRVIREARLIDGALQVAAGY